MNPTSNPRHRLATAVALAVTTGLLASPAVAATAPHPAPAAVAADQQAAAAITLPQGSQLVGNGPSGFLTRHRDGGFAWTRYADGVTTALPAGAKGTVRADTVVVSSGTTHTVYDMSGGASPVAIDIAFLGAGATLMDLAGSTLVVSVPRADGSGGLDVHLVGKAADGKVVDRTVSGLPADAVARSFTSQVDSPDALSLLYYEVVNNAADWHTAVVDVATATVVEERRVIRGDYDSDVTLSATHLAWAESPAADEAVALDVARRNEPETTRIPIGHGSRVQAELMGDWLAYGDTNTLPWPNPLYGLTLRSLTTGRTVKVLDSVATIRSQSDTELLVQGGTVDQGEGIYRIAPGPDGTPTATLVASTGLPIVLQVVEQSAPTTADFRTRAGDVKLTWRFSQPTTAHIELIHTASGKRKTYTENADGTGRATATWNGLLDDFYTAPNGDYTWRMTAAPYNGIGPSVERTGTIKVDSGQGPHNFSDSGSPDLLVRGNDNLYVFDSRKALEFAHTGAPTPTNAGAGWAAYDRVLTPGNIGGARYSDLVTRDKTGVLWIHPGTGDAASPFAQRVRVGGGWNTYTDITGNGDLDGDGRPDLVATDKAGDLWFYKGTGNTSAPFAPRRKTGHGWNIYNKLVATGNIGGGTTGDLVARDTSGVLWLYLGKGDGTFAARTRIGGGWNAYNEIVAVGDIDRDGRPDLLANGRTGHLDSTLALYRGTGDWRAPFSPRAGATTLLPAPGWYTTLF
ncbi:FG-GAP repeat domain-containing protein [Streptomyces sp. NPDC053513]|uniref:FG-GAP repeat domain-containing protein n=1 Tax=unclassified Streptomyces TaxID=2593676 RepID=UPI0037D28EE6